MMVLIYVSLGITGIYFLMSLWVFAGYIIGTGKKATTTQKLKTFSIVIAFKDEEEKLPALLSSLKKLRYPEDAFEIIMVDDASTDNGKSLIKTHNITGLRLLESQKGEGKKAALETGINAAKFEYIITTDADCIVQEGWLESYNRMEEADMMIGWVKTKSGIGALDVLQETEWGALQSMGVAGCAWGRPLLNNGANLCYRHNQYDSNGIKKETASGDDTFLLENFLQRKLCIRANVQEEGIVTTLPAHNWASMIQQKVRWASKTKYSSNHLMKIFGYVVAAMNLVIITLFASTLCKVTELSFLVLIYLTKAICDMLMIMPYALATRKTHILFYPLAVNMFYPVYFMWVLCMSIKGDYAWKGRRYHA